MKTSGHLVSNGGVRGHSAGDFFPFRVIAKGSPYTVLTWQVIGPKGDVVAVSSDVHLSFSVARDEHARWAA